MRSLTKSSFALSLGLAVAWPMTAHAAMAPQAVADALVATFLKGQASFERVAAAGADVTLSGFKLVGEDGSTTTIATVLVVNPNPRASGGFTADRVTFDKGLVKSDGVNFEWQSGAVIGAVIPSAAEIKNKAGGIPFAKMTVAGISFEAPNLPDVMKIASMSVALGAVTNGIPHDVQASFDGIRVPLSFLEDEPEVQAMAKSLGYEGFTVGFGFDGLYDEGNDAVNVRSLTFSAEQVGKVVLSAKLAGVPLAKMSDPDDLFDTAKIGEFTVRFENTGIVDRVLDMQSKSAGVSRAELVDQTAGAIPLMLTLGAVGSEAFQAKVAAEATAFLKSPKSISFVAAPASPMAFFDFFGLDPAEIVDALKLDVRANR
ncbi:MAG: hypothetical protein U1E56_05835 [Bauldia sp.]